MTLIICYVYLWSFHQSPEKYRIEFLNSCTSRKYLITIRGLPLKMRTDKRTYNKARRNEQLEAGEEHRRRSALSTARNWGFLWGNEFLFMSSKFDAIKSNPRREALLNSFKWLFTVERESRVENKFPSIDFSISILRLLSTIQHRPSTIESISPTYTPMFRRMLRR